MSICVASPTTWKRQTKYRLCSPLEKFLRTPMRVTMIKYTSFYDRVFTFLHNSSLHLNRNFFLIPLRWRIRQILLYHQRTLDDSQSYFPQCIPPWLNPAVLRVHQDKQQINIGSELPLVLPHWSQWKGKKSWLATLFYLHGLLPVPAQQ